MKTFVCCALISLALRASAGTPDAEYFAGLSFLDAGSYGQAAAKFEAACAASPEDVRFVLALGVAQLLGEHSTEALATMQRAYRLTSGTNRATRMWLSAAQCMAGDLEHARMTGGFNFNDPYDKLIYDAFNTYGLSIFQARNGADAQQLAAWKREALAKFPEVAREFSRHSKTGAGAAVNEAIITQAADLFRAGNYAAALTAIEQARTSGHDDVYAAWLHGEILLHCDAPEAARAVFTDLLTLSPDASAAYLGRAQAHALLGEFSSARRDLAHSRERAASDPRLRLDAGAPARQKEIEKLLSEPTGDAAELMQQLVDKPGDWNTSIATASRVHHAGASSRLRWDETYQEGLRAATIPTLDNPRDADAWAALAEYLDRNRLVWATSVEPRAKPQTFRTYRQQYEINGIIQAADAALARNPKHARAMTSRASAMIAGGDYAGAEQLLRKAMAIHPVPQTFELLNDLVTRAAEAKAGEAAARRRPRTETTRETRSDGEYIVTKTYPPSAADLARAEELDAEARVLFAEAADLYKRLLSATRGTPDEKFYRARDAWSHGDGSTAISLLRELTGPRPSDPRYHHQLLDWLRAGDAATYDEQFSDSANRIHSTAAGMLRIAWRAVGRGAFNSASDALARARPLDLTDSRILVYSGIIADEQNQTDRAVAFYRSALAMEEARLRLLGRGIEKGTTHLGPDDWPLCAEASLRLSALLTRSGRDKEAADVLSTMSRGLSSRVDLPDPFVTSREAMALPAGQLPSSQVEPGTIPEAPPANALLAWMHVASGNILRDAGRANDAGAAYVAALKLTRAEVRPLESYSRDEKDLLAEARKLIPARIIPRFDMAMSLAQQGAIESGAIKSAKQIYQEQQAAHEKQYQAAGDIDREYARRSMEINADFAARRRAIDRFDAAGMKAIQEDCAGKQKDLQAWREEQMRKLYGPGYR